LDLKHDSDREILAKLLASANLFVEATPLGYLEKFAFDDQRFKKEFSHLVIVSLTPFGRTGPYRHYKGSDAIANATGGFLFGQGDDTKGQCTAPSHLAYQMAGGVAAMLALAGIRYARETGAGQRIDMSLQEALTFANSSSIARYSRENRLERHLAAAPLNTIGEFVDCEQNRVREWLQEVDHPVIGKYKAPGAPMRLSLTPMRVRWPAPLRDQHRKEILAELENLQASPRKTHGEFESRRPMLTGLRMADLTQQYAGPLGTELLAYYGMEVVKIETGTIASKEREAAVHACMNRAKLGCTLNLRNVQGKELFKQLVAKADVVVDNFSSGVLERLGFSFDVLQQINPRIVQAVMPGWGLTGPLKSWVAWGWQLLAYTGIMRLWGYPDSPMETRCKIAWPD